MLRIVVLFILLFKLGNNLLFAQKTIPLIERNVSGVLKDSLNKPILGATVRLFSVNDTLETSTNQFGFYGFKGVKSAEFLLSIRALGYDPYNSKFFNNDTKPQLNIPPIRLGVKVEELENIAMDRLKGPTVKGDTTEFWAKDYIVRDYARLEDLLRRMEGINIDTDGSVFYNGERVVKALFNNSQYFTGSVQEAMKELPADIVERIQIIDQNETATGSKNLKTDESTKVLNIVTKPDKSAGRMYDFSFEQGTQSRTKVEGYLRLIDGSDQTSVRTGYKKFPEGVKTNVTPGSIGKGPMTRETVGGAGAVTEGHRDEIMGSLGKNLKIGSFSMYPQYDFNLHDSKTGVESISENFYEEGHISRHNMLRRTSREQKHSLQGSFNNKLENGGFLSGNFKGYYQFYDQSRHQESIRTGLVNSLEKEGSTKKGNSLNYQFNADYSLKLNKKWGFNAMLISSYASDEGDENLRTDVYGQAVRESLPDSTVHQLRAVNTFNFRNSIRNNFTWRPEDKLKVQYTVTLQTENSLRDIQSSLLSGQNVGLDPMLSNYQKNNLISVPLGVQTEYTLRNGIVLSPSIELNNSWLEGQLNPGTPSINRYDALWRPRMKVGYTGNRFGTAQVGYGTMSQQPGIAQLNPNAYYSTPYDVQIGNPNLMNVITKTFDFRYSKFFNKIGLNVSFMGNLSKIDQAVAANRVLDIDSMANVITTMTRYLNVDGAERSSMTMNLTKNIKKMNSTLSYNGLWSKNIKPYFVNAVQELRNSTMQQHILTFFYSPFKWIDIAPELRYRADEDRNSLKTFTNKTFNRVFFTEMKLSFYLPKNFGININASQSLFETTNIMSNTKPFVLNANIEKRIFKEKNGVVSLVVMDAARQNAFTNYSSHDYGYSNTVTNLDSRYFLLQFSWQPQRWGKSKHDSGKGRLGDGSFLN